MGGGGDGGASDIRAQEDERNRKQRESTQLINEMFDGRPASKRGVGAQTTSFVPGQTYYDATGMPVIPAQANLPAPSNGPVNLGPRPANPNSTPLYTGFEEVPGTPGFDDNYFKSIADAYMAYQTPLMEQQITDARRALPTRFASTASSAYQRQRANLERDYAQEQTNLASKSLDFANQQRGEVEKNRADLIGMANSGTDASALASQTAARAAALSKPPAFSPIADLFSKYTQSAGTVAQAGMIANQNKLLYGAPSTSVRTVN